MDGEEREQEQEYDWADHLRRVYTLVGHPLAYANEGRIFRYYQGLLSRSQIRDILSGIESYSIHKEFHRGPKNPSYSHFKRYQFQIDLVDVRHLAEFNDGVNYLLTCIDTFTRFAFARMLLSKHGDGVLEAFKSILEEAESPPLTLVMDRGTEFFNEKFENFCSNNNIKYFPPDSSVHGAYIERFNRTLQGLIYRHMTENETSRYVDVQKADYVAPLMPLFLSTYNNSYHRMIGTTPAIAENDPSTHVEIAKKMSAYRQKIKSKKPVLEVGDLVRLAKLRGKFDRGYNDRATTEIFKIHGVANNLKIPMYSVSNYAGDEILRGKFYANELVKVTAPEDVYRIERVLKRRIRNGVEELLVKWKGFDDSYNSWIPKDNVERVF